MLSLLQWIYGIWRGPRPDMQHTRAAMSPIDYAHCQRCNGNLRHCDYDWSGACTEAERVTGDCMAGFWWNAERARSGRR